MQLFGKHKPNITLNNPENIPHKKKMQNQQNHFLASEKLKKNNFFLSPNNYQKINKFIFSAVFQFFKTNFMLFSVF